MTEIEKKSKKEHKEKQELKDKEEKYYEDKIEELGLSKLDRFLKYLPDPSDHMKKGITYAHKDFDKVVSAIVNKKSWSVVSGLNPSGPLHFGHKTIFDELLWLQKQGADIFIPLTNDESYLVGKTETLAEAKKIAYELVIPSIIAMGFDPKKTHIFVDSDYPQIYNLGINLSKKLTLNRVQKVFGTDEAENTGTLFYRGATQLAQILLPQLKEFGGPKITLIPVGIDQHPYILLSRDIANKMKMLPPAEIIIRFLPGLTGPGEKMSASVGKSSVYLTDSEKEAESKVMGAYTGGLTSGKVQKEIGGVPEICPIFLLQKYHFLNEKESKDLQERCSTGKILCSECKKNTATFVKDYLKKHKKEREKAKKKIKEFLLKDPLESAIE
jgi:tryptophanyl-tRNA synthetase